MSQVVVTRPIPRAPLDLLRAAHEVVVRDFPSGATEDDLIAAVGEAEAMLSMLSDPVTARVLSACPRLKVVAQYAVGYDNIDLEAARERGIAVTHTPGVLTEATADFAFALLLAAARRIVEADRYVRAGRFERWETMALLGSDLHGKTLGIVGMGRIGLAVARRASGFGMRILYHNRRPANPTLARRVAAEYVPLDVLLAESDVVSLHCALTPETHHLIDAAALARMKPTALLVNTARGKVVDEEALVEALRAESLGGAGLDVFEDEPAVHPGLIDHERVVLAPHLGSATVEVRTAMGRMCAEAILAALDENEQIPYRIA